MKLDKIKDAASTAEVYSRVQDNLAWAKKATAFDASCGPGDALMTVIGRGGVRLDMGGLSGQLAHDLKAAIIKYHEGHLALAADSLKKLGVDVQ